MLLGEHYRVGGRWRIKFFRRACMFMHAENRFVFGGYRYDISSGVSQWTFQSRANGYIFKLVGRNHSFMLLQVNRRDDEGWDTPVIRNYFGFLEFMLSETGEGYSVELM